LVANISMAQQPKNTKKKNNGSIKREAGLVEILTAVEPADLLQCKGQR